MLKQFYIDGNSKAIGISIVEVQLPIDFLILLIKRDEEYIRPIGSTIFREDDILLIQCDEVVQYDKIIKQFY